MVIFFGVGCCSQVAHQGGTAEGYERCLAIAINVALHGTTVVCGSNQFRHGMATIGWPGYRLAIQRVDGENLLGGLVQPVQRLNTGAALQISAIM